MPARAAGSRVSSRCGARPARSHPITQQRLKPLRDSGREDSRRLAFLLLAIVGSALIGAGIILLIAHNWDELSRPVRSAIAFLPLLASHALSVFVLRRRDGSQPWRESAAIFNVAAIGAAISLVSQTYQIHGDFARFVLATGDSGSSRLLPWILAIHSAVGMSLSVSVPKSFRSRKTWP